MSGAVTGLLSTLLAVFVLVHNYEKKLAAVEAKVNLLNQTSASSVSEIRRDLARMEQEKLLLIQSDVKAERERDLLKDDLADIKRDVAVIASYFEPRQQRP